MENTIREVKRTERGWAGHFVGAHHCEFRRNTLLECGEERLVVSTIGAYTPKQDGKYAWVNAYGFYETLVFKAGKEPFWDADTTRQVLVEGTWYIDKLRSFVDIEANNMHEAAVCKVTEHLREGSEIK